MNVRIPLVFPLISLCVVGCPSAPPAASSGVTAPSASPIASAKSTSTPSTTSSADTSASAAALAAEVDKMHVATLGVIGSTAPSSSSTGAPTKPDVQIGGLQGADAVPDAATVVAKTRVKFKKCYDKALADDASAAGKMKLSIVVRADGNVDKLKVVSSTVSKSLETCIVGAASFMTFSPPTGSEPTLTFSVVMVPKG